MNHSSTSDIESTPLLVQDAQLKVVDAVEEVPAATSSSSLSKAALVLFSIIALSAVAHFSYERAGGMTLATQLKRNTLYAPDVAICENTFVEGVTPRTAAFGCVVLSNDDLYGDNYLTDAMHTQTVCIASTGPSNGRVAITYKNMKDLGFIDDDGKSILSGINPGADVNVVLYSGRNFDGESVTVNAGTVDGALPVKQYLSGTTTNDNVYSLSVVSQAQYFFAGPQCGQDTQICTGLIENAEAVKPQSNGCALVTAQDPTAPGKEKSSSAAVRFCTTEKAAPYNAGVVVVNKDTLESLGMVKHFSSMGGGEAAISFINKQGESTNLAYYTTYDATGKHHAHTGRLGIWNDKIYSLTISSSTNQLPADCGSIVRYGQH